MATKPLVKLNVMLVASTGVFQKNLQRAEKRVQSFALKINKFGGTIGTHLASAFRRASIAVAAFGVGLIYLTKQTAEAIDSQTKMARRLGLTYNELKSFELAAGLAGVSSEELNKAFEKMLDTIGAAQYGEGTAIKAFEQIGISMEDLARMRPEEQFKAIGKAIAAIPDPAQRIAAARDIFGRGGGVIIELFRGGAQAIADAEKTLKLFGITLNSVQTKKIEDMNDRLSEAKLIFVGIGTQLAEVVAPYITQLVKDTKAWLEQMGGLEAVADKAFGKVADWLDKIIEKTDKLITWAKLLYYLSPVGGIDPEAAAGIFAGGNQPRTPVSDALGSFEQRVDQSERYDRSVREQEMVRNAPVIPGKYAMVGPNGEIQYHDFKGTPGAFGTPEERPNERKRIARGSFADTQHVALLRQIAINTGQGRIAYAG